MDDKVIELAELMTRVIKRINDDIIRLREQLTELEIQQREFSKKINELIQRESNDSI